MADSDAPWAMQIAVRVEKLHPPSTSGACGAAALATIALLDDARSAPDGEWHEPVAAWNGARIRKIVRRARGAGWTRAHEAAGVTVTTGHAEARAFVPSPVDDVPRPVTKLQIHSTPLDEVATIDHLPNLGLHRMAIAVTPAVEMTWGKQAAQCAHAAQRLWMQASIEQRAAWDTAGRGIDVLHASASLWERLDELAEVRIHDGGYTEIPAGTNTTAAWWALQQGEASKP